MMAWHNRAVSGALSLTSTSTPLMIPLVRQITAYKALWATFAEKETIKTYERVHVIDVWTGRQGQSEIRVGDTLFNTGSYDMADVSNVSCYPSHALTGNGCLTGKGPPFPPAFAAPSKLVSHQRTWLYANIESRGVVGISGSCKYVYCILVFYVNERWNVGRSNAKTMLLHTSIQKKKKRLG